ncbi:MAG: hypothetical protein J6Q15_03515 [Clostridia bacterium]|nr:hypothetical protein [Clostridia bacterium]
MFIEKLWEENPELVTKAVKKIYDVREERGDSLKFIQLSNGALRFEKYGHCSFGIVLTDFEAYGHTVNSGYNIKWLRFMKSVFGLKYVYQYIAYRNEKLDRFMAEYEDNYNKETKKVLAELGMDKYKDEQNQTK